MSSSYFDPQMVSLKAPKKKRVSHIDGLKKLDRVEINDDGYTKETGAGTGDKSFGEHNQDRAPWLTNLHNLSGPEGVMRDKDNWMTNMPGNPHSTLPSFGSTCNINIFLRRAVQDSFKEQLRRALSRLKASGVIPETMSLDDVKITIPGHGDLTVEQLSEELAKLALQVIKQTEVNAPKQETEDPGIDAGLAASLGSPSAQGAAPTSSSPIDQAIGGLEQAAGVVAKTLRDNKKTGVSLMKERALKKKPDLFEPSKNKIMPFRYTHPTHQERTLPEGDSKYEQETNIRERHMDSGQREYDAPQMTIEPNMGGDPMRNYVSMLAS